MNGATDPKKLIQKTVMIFMTALSLALFFTQKSECQDTYVGPAILPPAKDAPGGGNPLQGLGRPDDPSPSRLKEFGYPTYNSTSFDSLGQQNLKPPPLPSDNWGNFNHSDTAGTVQSPGSQENYGNNSSSTGTPAGASSLTPYEASVKLQNERDARTLDFIHPKFIETGNNGIDPLSFTRTVRGVDRDPAENNYNTISPTRPPVDPSQPLSRLPPPAGGRFDSFIRRKPNAISAPDLSGARAFDERFPSFFDRGKGKKANKTDAAKVKLPDAGDKQQHLNDGDSALLPPIVPAVEFGSGGMNRSSGTLSDAVADIKVGFYPRALITVDNFLKTEPKSADAHYLKAVISVYSQNFSLAKTEYQQTLNYSKSDELSERARIGLNKLSR